MMFSYLSGLVFLSAVLGQTVLRPNNSTNKCLDVRGDLQANGTAVQIFDCNNTPAQLWELTAGPTAVRLNGTDFCLDAGNSPKDGTHMKIWKCFPGIPAQSWFLTADARIALEGQGLCLDLTDGKLTNTNVIQVWKCTDGDKNQIWRERI